MKKPIKPVIVEPPKKRIPMAPPEQVHRNRKTERDRVPSGRRAKHKKKLKAE
jgi:hypothetical protein